MRSRALLTSLLAAITVVSVAPAAATTTSDEVEAKLEQVQQQRADIEDRLATEAGDLEGLEETIHEAEQEVAVLEDQEADLRGDLGEIEERMATRARSAFMGGEVSTLQLLLSGQDVGDVTDGATLLESLSLRDRAQAEEADAVRTAIAATREARQERLAELEELQGELQTRVDTLMADLEELQEAEAEVADELERVREEERRRREEELRRQRERERREAAAAAASGPSSSTVSDSGSGGGDTGSSGGGSSAPAPSSGGYACPVGNPVAFADTWGAPRSGGRAHKGVDMMAPHGTPSYAITSGTITRMNGNSLGGISLYMYGDDGNQYYYTHLQGYANISVGQRVSAGTLIAYVGSTGNASASAPHLHLEVHPGGGGAVNPYPYAAMACGR